MKIDLVLVAVSVFAGAASSVGAELERIDGKDLPIVLAERTLIGCCGAKLNHVVLPYAGAGMG